MLLISGADKLKTANSCFSQLLTPKKRCNSHSCPALLSHPQYIYSNRQLHSQNRWQTILKIPMLRLMPKCIHSHNRPKTSTKNCTHKKRLLRNPPRLTLRTALITPHKNKPHDINNYQIYQNNIFHFSYPLQVY